MEEVEDKRGLGFNYYVDDSEAVKFVVIGSGPAGLYASLVLATRGEVTLVEKAERLGGTCVNFGCVPGKAMIRPLALSYWLSRFNRKVDFDLEELQRLAKEASSRVSKGEEYLLEDAGVKVVHGVAKVKSGTVEVNGQTLAADGVVVATGLKRPEAVSSDDLPELKGLKKVALIGGGVGGVEYGWLLKVAGKEVHIYESGPYLLPRTDRDLSVAVTNHFRKLGVKLHLNVQARVEGNSVITNEGREEFDAVIWTFGRRPNVDGIELPLDDRGFIKVDERMYTGVGNVYAAGDVTGSFTAHEAMRKGVVAGLNLIGIRTTYSGLNVPEVIYTEPQIARFGKTEGECVRVDMASLTRGVADKATEGFVKLCFEEGKLVGALAFSHRAEEIVTLASAMAGKTIEEIVSSQMPHPSYVEAVWEGAFRLLLKKLRS